MNTTHHKQGSQTRYPHMKRLLTALFVAAMVMILSVPVFAVETMANESAPDTEVSTSTPDLAETPADEDGDVSEPTPEPTSSPVSTLEELLDAIAHANANDVIELDAYISVTPSELVLGRADCPVTIRRTTYDACLILGYAEDGNLTVQNITFDGAGIPASYPFILTSSPKQVFENCSFVNCVVDRGAALEASRGETLISNCRFANNRGSMGAHLRIDSPKAIVENCTFTGGYALFKGPVLICTMDETHLIGCTITGNAAGEQGGGIYLVCGSLSITESKIYGNTANGVTDDITTNYGSFLSLMDDYAALVELYKPDGVIPNMWTVDSYFSEPWEMNTHHAGMVFSMTFVDDVAPTPAPAPEPEIITVIFNANGGTVSPASVTINKGSTIILPTPEREGYTFDGWFMEDGTPVTTNTVFTEDMEIHAKWTEKESEPDPKPEPLPTSITLDKSELTLDIGETAILTATLHPEGRSNGIQWTSGDSSVASVTENGLITAHSSGTTSITATTSDGEASASCRVNVQVAPVTTYSISVSASPTEGGTVSGGGQYKEGTTITVTAVPNEGFRFLEWAEANAQIGADASLTFAVTSDRKLTAIFEPVPDPTPKPTYTINTSATEGGTASGGGEYEQGSTVTLTATPENGYLFIGWTEHNEQISTDEHFTFIVDRDRTFAANFAPITQPTYTINTSATVGGTAIGGGNYALGSSVTLTAISESGYFFVEWTENGEQVSADESFIFIADRDRTLVANFAPIPTPLYTIQVHSTKGGDAEGSGSYEEGETVTVNAVPDAGYCFLYWEENGVQVSTDECFTFIAEQDRTLVANFKLIPKPTYTIQVNSTRGGIAEGSGSYEEGKLITVNAVPDKNCRFLRWEENGLQVSAEAQYSFTVEEDRTLIAVFDLLSQSIMDLTYKPPYDPGPPTTHGPRSNNAQSVVTSVSAPKEVQIPKLMNGKAVLIAPDDSFWVGYKTGRDNGTETVTRADLAQLVYSVMDNESRKIYGVTQSPFRDVEPGAWYEAAAGTMLNTGIMFGCGDGLFCPDRTLTWGELLTVFARFTADKPLTEYYVGEHWAKNAVNKAFALGWLEYTEVFDPGRAVTTGEMVDLIQAVFRWNSE